MPFTTVRHNALEDIRYIPPGALEFDQIAPLIVAGVVYPILQSATIDSGKLDLDAACRYLLTEGLDVQKQGVAFVIGEQRTDIRAHQCIAMGGIIGTERRIGERDREIRSETHDQIDAVVATRGGF